MFKDITLVVNLVLGLAVLSVLVGNQVHLL